MDAEARAILISLLLELLSLLIDVLRKAAHLVDRQLTTGGKEKP